MTDTPIASERLTEIIGLVRKAVESNDTYGWSFIVIELLEEIERCHRVEKRLRNDLLETKTELLNTLKRWQNEVRGV